MEQNTYYYMHLNFSEHRSVNGHMLDRNNSQTVILPLFVFSPLRVALFPHLLAAWSIRSRMEADLVMKALLMAVWRRNPKKEVIVHSDQDSQYTGYYWQDFLKAHNLKCSMSR
jgi:hypothetical protein